MNSVDAVRTQLRLPFRLSAGEVASRFFDGVRRKEIRGNRCEVCGCTYVPPRSFCARCWERCGDWIPIGDEGTITTYVIVNVPFYGQEVEIPYVLAHILLDGADTTLQHLVGTGGLQGRLIAPEEVRIGMRVAAVWHPTRRTGFPSDDIDHFTPTADPDRALVGGQP